MKNNKNIITYILVIIICILSGLIVFLLIRNNELERVNKTYKDNNKVEQKEEIKYNYEPHGNCKIYTESNNSFNDFHVLEIVNENEKYEQSGDYLTLINGVPTMIKDNKKIESKIKNIKKMYIIHNGEYITDLAYLSNDGYIYYGDNLIVFNDNDNTGEKQWIFNEKIFDNVKKLDSNNKYKSIYILDITDVSNWTNDDSYNYEILAESIDGKFDLVK